MNKNNNVYWSKNSLWPIDSTFVLLRFIYFLIYVKKYYFEIWKKWNLKYGETDLVIFKVLLRIIHFKVYMMKMLKELCFCVCLLKHARMIPSACWDQMWYENFFMLEQPLKPLLDRMNQLQNRFELCWDVNIDRSRMTLDQNIKKVTYNHSCSAR